MNATSSAKPAGFIRTAVHLPVRDLTDTIAYYRDVLGFYDEWTLGTKDGGIRRDEMRLLFAEDPVFATAINNEHHRLPLLWFVNQIGEVYEELKEKVVLSDSLRKHAYGLWEFAFIDINGYYIRVAQDE